MVDPARARSERRKHPRFPANSLIAEIRGKQYEVVDISFGGMKIDGTFTVAGGLVDAIVVPLSGHEPVIEEQAQVRGRVERVDGDLTAVRFSNLTEALTKLIGR